MANTTLFVLLIASLCLVGQSAPLSDVEVIIREAIEINVKMAIGEIKQTAGQSMATATPIQRRCIGKALGIKTSETVLKIKETARQLRTELNTPDVDLDSARTQVRDAIGAIRIQAVESALQQIAAC